MEQLSGSMEQPSGEYERQPSELEESSNILYDVLASDEPW
jgi:hypothetical protein